MFKVLIKPLSVNKAWKGRRFRSEDYKAYQELLTYKLPSKIDVPDGLLKLTIVWGFSSHGSDNDNPVKPFQDIISKKYEFNDNKIYHHEIFKDVVKKGDEYILFQLSEFDPSTFPSDFLQLINKKC